MLILSLEKGLREDLAGKALNNSLQEGSSHLVTMFQETTVKLAPKQEGGGLRGLRAHITKSYPSSLDSTVISASH